MLSPAAEARRPGRPLFRVLVLPAALTVLCFALVASLPRIGDAIGLGPGSGLAAGLRLGIGAAAWIALAWTLTRLVTELLRPYPRLLTDLLSVALFGTAAVAIMLLVLEWPATGLIATSSVLIAVIGYAMRNTFGDVFSGIALGIEHPYAIGDWIEAMDGCTGQVVQVTWRATRLQTPDGIVLTVPNGLVAAHRVVNYSAVAAGRYRTAMRVPMDPTLPPERVRRILLAAALDAARFSPDLDPDVLLAEFRDGAAIYLVRFHLPDFGADGHVRDLVGGAVLRALHQADLDIARPAQEVRLRRLPRAGTSVTATALDHVDLFRPFTPEERAELVSHMTPRTLPRGATVVRHGEAGRSLFVLAEGALDVLIHGEDAGEIATDRLLPGAVFGEMSLLTGQPRSATVVAATEAVVHEVMKEHLDPILQRRPEVLEALSAIMLERQGQNRQRLTTPQQARTPAPTRADLLARLRAFFLLDSH